MTRPAKAHALFDRSHVAEHNDDAQGHWLIVDGGVYDVSELMRIHPGGPRILQLHAGCDASEGFRRVHHGGHKLDRLLARARLGRVRELACMVSPEHASHRAAANALLCGLSLVVEMQNALRADHAFRLRPPHARDEQQPCIRRSRYELQSGLETHARFQREYLDVLLGVGLPRLAAAILPADAQRVLRSRVEQLQSLPLWAAARALPGTLLDRFERLADAELDLRIGAFELQDSELLRVWKRELSGVLRVFECAHQAALQLTQAPLVRSLCDRLLGAIAAYIRTTASDQ